MTAHEVIQCKIFDQVRDYDKEKVLNKMKLAVDQGDKSYQIFLPIDSQDAFDYENPVNAKYTIDDLRQILTDEVLEF